MAACRAAGLGGGAAAAVAPPPPPPQAATPSATSGTAAAPSRVRGFLLVMLAPSGGSRGNAETGDGLVRARQMLARGASVVVGLRAAISPTAPAVARLSDCAAWGKRRNRVARPASHGLGRATAHLVIAVTGFELRDHRLVLRPRPTRAWAAAGRRRCRTGCCPSRRWPSS